MRREPLNSLPEKSRVVRVYVDHTSLAFSNTIAPEHPPATSIGAGFTPLLAWVGLAWMKVTIQPNLASRRERPPNGMLSSTGSRGFGLAHLAMSAH